MCICNKAGYYKYKTIALNTKNHHFKKITNKTHKTEQHIITDLRKIQSVNSWLKWRGQEFPCTSNSEVQNGKNCEYIPKERKKKKEKNSGETQEEMVGLSIQRVEALGKEKKKILWFKVNV